MTKNKSNAGPLYRVMFEDFQPDTSAPLAAPNPAETEQPQNISLDQKVDRYLVQYERESMPDNGQGPTGPTMAPAMTAAIGIQERKTKKHNLLGSLLWEADEPPPDDAPLDAGPTDDLPGLDQPTEPEEPEEPSTPSPQININNFAEKVARLVSNYETLLDPKTTILNRVQTYITKNYNEKVAKELMIVLETQFSLTPLTKDAETQQNPPAPMAVGAAGDAIGAGTGGS